MAAENLLCEHVAVVGQQASMRPRRMAAENLAKTGGVSHRTGQLQ